MSDLPPLFAHVHVGLEPITADEISRDLGGEVKKILRGVVVFRTDAIDKKLLRLRTSEDLFMLAWGSDSLTYRATDLKLITQWTAKLKWDKLFKLHQQVREMPRKPTFHLVCQMQGEHGYRRVDALDAMGEGLRGRIPPQWLPADENAWLEIWLVVNGKTAMCGVRLSDRTMRHRPWKIEHIAASLRPSVAAAMVRLAGLAPGMVLLDDFCGAGTILGEQIELQNARKITETQLIGGDIDPQALYCAGENLRKLGTASLMRADAQYLPLTAESVDRIVSNPPFGKQLSTPEEVPPLYRQAAREWDRVLKPGGKAVLLAAEQEALQNALLPLGWLPQRQLKVRILGQLAILSVWQKPA